MGVLETREGARNHLEDFPALLGIFHFVEFIDSLDEFHDQEVAEVAGDVGAVSDGSFFVERAPLFEKIVPLDAAGEGVGPIGIAAASPVGEVVFGEGASSPNFSAKTRWTSGKALSQARSSGPSAPFSRRWFRSSRMSFGRRAILPILGFMRIPFLTRINSNWEESRSERDGDRQDACPTVFVRALQSPFIWRCFSTIAVCGKNLR